MLENQMRFCFYESLRFFLSWDGFFGLFFVQKAMFSGIKPFMSVGEMRWARTHR